MKSQLVCGDPLEYQGYDYETVQIGEQCWFAENLRAENYRNGDAIPTLLGSTEWATTVLGALAVFGEGSLACSDLNEEEDECDQYFALNEYGRLYNWYAVDDARGLCPGGWHIPSDGEWMAMEMVLGMSEAEANEIGLKEPTKAPNENGQWVVRWWQRHELERFFRFARRISLQYWAIWWCWRFLLFWAPTSAGATPLGPSPCTDASTMGKRVCVVRPTLRGAGFLFVAFRMPSEGPSSTPSQGGVFDGVGVLA